MPPQDPEQARWFVEQVQTHEPALRAYIRRRFPDVLDVDDLIQESFVRVLRAKGAGPIACARAYLFTTARNVAYALFRRPRIFADNPVTDSAILRIAEKGADVAEKVSAAEEVALLLDAVDTLPARCREIFILRKLQGVPQKEIARRLGLSEQTVQVQVARGAKKCAQFLHGRGVIGRSVN